MFGKAGLGGLMQQAQKMQEKLAQTEVEGQAGNGLVKVIATCSHDVRQVKISPDLIAQATDDAEMLEDLVLAALSDAYAKGEAATSARMSQFTQGLPAGMGDFFK